MGGTTTQVVTFSIEMLLMLFCTTSICWFMSYYVSSFLKIPPIVFMWTDPVSVMASVNVVGQMLIFSTRRKAPGGAFGDSILSQVSQGFAIVSSVMWVGFILLMFADVPRITSVPGSDPSASVVAGAIVIGFTFLVPVLALIISFTALPAGESNSLVFNGSTVGVLSLLFFVSVSFGSGGVMRCPPFDGAGTGLTFTVFVIVYFVLLYLTELVVFYEWSPITSLWRVLTGGRDNKSSKARDNGQTYFQELFGGVLGTFGISYWRVPGAALNGAIILTTLLFSSSSVHGMVGIMFVVVLALHVPLIVTINADAVLMGHEDQYESVAVVNQSGKSVSSFNQVRMEPPNIRMHSGHTVPDARSTPFSQSQIFPVAPMFPVGAVGSDSSIDWVPRQRRGLGGHDGFYT
jgi:hypothetical protein